MTQKEQHKKLGDALWGIANDLRGAMNADDFRDYMLSFLFLRYLSFNYEEAAKKELGKDYPPSPSKDLRADFLVPPPLEIWYKKNKEDIIEFEEQMRKKVHYVIKPNFLWSNITELARTQNEDLLEILQKGFRYIEDESFESSFQGLFSEINLNSEKLGKTEKERNDKLCKIITKIAEGVADFSTDADTLGNAYEYLIGQFAAGSGKKAGEYYTPQKISTILSRIVLLDPHDPTQGYKDKLNRVLDFTCGSGSLLLNVRNQLKNEIKGKGTIGKIFGQEKNITTYNLARMNMLLHGMKDTEFEIFHGDTLLNQWNLFNQINPSKKIEFDAIVANPPFSLRWEPNDTLADDFRFKGYGLAPKSAADFAFLLHGLHFLSNEGTMAIILPHGVLFRGGAESRIREKLLQENSIDTVIGLPSNLFYSTGIPVCILVLKKCKKEDDVLFINASEQFVKEKRQNELSEKHLNDIVETYKFRKERERYSRRVSMYEIQKNDYNLNISRYVNTTKDEVKIDLKDVNSKLVELNLAIKKHTDDHNKYLEELGLKPI
jgi:type I restriction enzyme M protein